MKYFIEDFIEATNSAKSREEIFDLYKKAIFEFGLDSAVYTFVTDHVTVNQKAGHGVKCNFPEDWMKHYASKDYVKIDPVIMEVLASKTAFTWKGMEEKGNLTTKQKVILRESEESGLRNGIGISLYGPRGEIAGVGLASQEKNIVNIDKNILSKLKLITEQFHLAYCSVSNTNNNNNIPKITDREREVLKWWASGKTSSEIATILNCKQVTVKFHIDNIYKKLEANSQILAVTKAIRLGIISLDSIDVSS